MGMPVMIEPIAEGVISLEWRVTYTCLATILVNLPFGYFRGRYKRLSFWWFVGIHAPVPFVIMIRKYFHLELSWELAPLLLGTYLIGQVIGKYLYNRFPYHRKNSE